MATKDSGEQIILIGSDGRRVQVSRAIATEASYVLRDLLDGREAVKGKGNDDPTQQLDGLESSSASSSSVTEKIHLLEVPVPFITGEVLELVWEHMKYRFYTAVAVDDDGKYGINVYPIPMRTIPKPMTLPLAEYLDSKDRKFISEWDEQLTILVVKAATLLRYDDLLQLSSAKLATFLLEKSVEGIRTLLSVECDFAPRRPAPLDVESVYRFIQMTYFNHKLMLFLYFLVFVVLLIMPGKSAIQIQIDELKEVGPEVISAEDLKDLIVSSSNEIKIIDLRSAEEFQTSHIAKSVNTAYDDLQQPQLVQELHSKKDKFSIVFVSLQSPDLDDFAARQCISLYQQTYNALPPPQAIKILFGGFSHWISVFGTDTDTDLLVSRERMTTRNKDPEEYNFLLFCYNSICERRKQIRKVIP
eukprot:gene4472-3266_t